MVRNRMGPDRSNDTQVVTPGGEAGPDEQYVLLREIFYSSDAEIGRTTEDATSKRSRSTTEDIPYSFESSNDYEGLETDRHTGRASADPENTMSTPGGADGGERTRWVEVVNPPPPRSRPP